MISPEFLHRAAITALHIGLGPRQLRPDPSNLATTLACMRLKNPIGIAAGFDKHGEAALALARMGFGMVEVGSVTPKPQPGNPKPRVFRLPGVKGVINRYGFNSHGHRAVYNRLVAQRESITKTGAMLGVNLGANKDSNDFVADYVAGISVFSSVADYLVINVSSPNTPGLRNLQFAALDRLLGETIEAREREPERRPVFLKISPDLTLLQIDAMAKAINLSNIDGLIISNTTLSRDMGMLGDAVLEKGGLSGQPLFDLSTTVLALMRQRTQVPIIGAGGITTVRSAVVKMYAGAQAIQIYSGLVYDMRLLGKIKRAMRQVRQMSIWPKVVGCAVEPYANNTGILPKDTE